VPLFALISNPRFDTNQNLSFNFKSAGTDSIGIVSMGGTYGNAGIINGTSASVGQVIASGTTTLLKMSSTKLATDWVIGSCHTANLFITYNLSSDPTPRNYTMTPT